MFGRFPCRISRVLLGRSDLDGIYCDTSTGIVVLGTGR